MSQPSPDAVPAHRYTPALAQQIELAWQDRWEAEGTFHTPNPTGHLAAGFERVADRPKAFVMDMFPYPSGAGLHVGHPLGYLGTDVTSRFLRMDGHNVLHPMGYDAFGLPAEQFAVQTGQHPRVTTEANIAAISAQLRRLGVDHDTRRTFATIDPGYYRWTQWIFTQVFGAWFDTAADKARPIEELVAELDAGTREPDTNPFDRPWAQLTEVERRQVVDLHRLAYLNQAPVNWCPGLGTVLSNEEVTADGRSERGNFPVFRRPLTQWMMRITAYSERLLADLDRLEWSDSLKQMQRNWIGRSTGARVRFGDIEVFTTRPDTLFGATYLVLAPEHPLVDALTAGSWPADADPRWTAGAATPAEAVAAYQLQASRRSEMDRQAEGRDKTGVWLGTTAVNPLTGRDLPVFIADYVLTGYGTGAIMAVPGEDTRDFEFADVFGLPVVRTVQPPEDFAGGAYTGSGPMINSSNDQLSLDGLDKAAAIATVTEWLVAGGHGESTTTYKLRDWLFSRQRYWGEPFPIVYAVDGPDAGLPVAVPADQLPVLLPDVDDYSPKTFADDDATSAPEPPLSRATEWTTATLDLGDGPREYRRETNTMPNWAGSCWYYLRYLDPADDEQFVDPSLEAYWMGPRSEGDVGGVDLYVGGVEHAVLHLLYARFWHKVLFDLGHVSSEEPFRRLVNQGYISAYAYTDSRGFYVPAADVVERDGAFFYEDQPVDREYGKIGKSLKNMVTPDEMIGAYGADTFRVYEMSTGPLEQSRPWDTKAVVGSQRLLQRVWRVVVDETTGEVRAGEDALPVDTAKALHRAVDGVRDGLATLRFNVAIARIAELTNHLTQAYGQAGPVPRQVCEWLTLLVSPLAPHVADELWSRLGHDGSAAWTPFPVADPALLVDDTVTVVVQVNGKVRAQVAVPADADAAALEAAARADERIVGQLEGKTVRRVIAVPGRLVNFVVG
ncbi:leucine--tRNA ligase [Geodermatophilus sp. Leaf369]|uniref:leucine--tRNA ligase n=1 Tax=Geodermatophilus sp. Leaf369 TaxID=1736354 RepID=UPI0006F540F6|nr:leucine--tRNA ligase [Geodermatophilus sp. Leaf369]KQS59804.1 leucine--tRNA ligase [Geodermatophilus sp. Leaf369]